MRKIMNFRPLALFGLSLAIGGYIFTFMFKSFVFAVISLGCLAITGIIFLFLIVLKRKWFLGKTLLCCVLLPIVLGASMIYCKEYKIINSSPDSGVYYTCGKVEKISQQDYGYNITLSNAEFIAYGTKYDVKGNVKLTVPLTFMDKELSIGDNISVKGYYTNYFNKIDFVNYYEAKSGYSGKLNAIESIKINKGSGFKYSILKETKNTIYTNMDENVAPIAFGMLFGDKSGMEEDVVTSFSHSGLSHVLAVSGLHVGFIISLFSFVLALLVKNKRISMVIMGIVIVIYAYLCGFSASIVRASVMAIISMFAKFRGAQYDGINSLSFSAIINFLINPLCIFSLSFLLSYSVVFSIFALSPSLKCILEKRLPKQMASSLALSLSAWIGGLALLLLYMKEFSFYSIIVNMLMVPFVGISFMCLCVTTIIALVPGLNFLFIIPNSLYNILAWVVEGVSSIKYAVIEVAGSFAGLIFCTLAIVLASDYVFHKRKFLFSSLFVLSFLVLTILNV